MSAAGGGKKSSALMPDGSPRPPPGMMLPPKGAPMSSSTPTLEKMRASFRKGSMFGTFMAVPKDLQPTEGDDEGFVSKKYDVRKLLAEKRRLEKRVTALQGDVATRDEHLSQAAKLASTHEALCAKELKLAEQELLMLDEQRSHEALMAESSLASMQERAGVVQGAVDLLAATQEERFRAVQLLNEERLSRREDAARMHVDLVRLRDYLDREMRMGLEAFREMYKEAALKQISDEGREAIERNYVLERRCTREASRAATWQRRHDAVAKTAAANRRALENERGASATQARRVVRLRQQVGELRGVDAEAQGLREALVQKESTIAQRDAALVASKEQIASLQRQQARSVQELRRVRMEAARAHAVAVGAQAREERRLLSEGRATRPIAPPRPASVERLAVDWRTSAAEVLATPATPELPPKPPKAATPVSRPPQVRAQCGSSYDGIWKRGIAEQGGIWPAHRCLDAGASHPSSNWSDDDHGHEARRSSASPALKPRVTGMLRPSSAPPPPAYSSAPRLSSAERLQKLRASTPNILRATRVLYSKEVATAWAQRMGYPPAQRPQLLSTASTPSLPTA